MGRLFRILTIAAVLLLPTGVAWPALTFIYPKDKGWVDRADHLIIKFNTLDATHAKVTVNGITSEPLNIGSAEYQRLFRDFLILQPLWDKGKNSLRIDLLAGDRLLETATAELFYSPKDAPLPIPAEYSASILHLADQESLCVPCHNMRPTTAQANAGPDRSNPCYTCHRRMLNQKQVHGPVGSFSCAYCHSMQGEPRYTAPKRDSLLCGECHVEMAGKLKKWKYLHGPVAAGYCEVCHDPHGSQNPAQLRQPINQLCLSCHEEIGRTPHVNTMSMGGSGGHPLSDRPDLNPRRKGKMLSCASCHNPHGADVRYYFNNNAEDRLQLCQFCHQK